MLNMLFEKKDFFLNLLWEHLVISLISIIIALFLGLLIGIFISEYNKSSKLILGLINFIYTIPSISLLGFLIPLSGIGNVTAIIALTIYALLPMVRNTHTGITNIDKKVLEAAKGMGSTRLQLLLKIKLPLAMPIIISGLRNMVTMTIALTGIASFIGAGGLGVAIYRGITTNNTEMTLIGSLLIALLAIVIDLILGIFEKMYNRRTTIKNKKTFFTIILSGILIITIISTYFISTSKNNTIHIATKPMTEQYIIGEMLKELIEKNTDLNVELTQGVGGGTSNIQPAMEKGEFDLYPEYTGTAWNMVLKKNGLYTEELFDKLNNEYKNSLNFIWSGMYGFNNTYCLAVRRDIAEKYKLTTYSDLATISDQLTFGAEYDFYEREDGYDSLSEAYNFKFKNTLDMDIGLKYKAISQKKIDVMTTFTTDGQLSSADLVVLNDDKQFYPSYMCGNVVRKETLNKYPKLKNILKNLDGILNDKIMSELNSYVELKGQEPKDVAHHFLQSLNLVN